MIPNKTSPFIIDNNQYEIIYKINKYLIMKIKIENNLQIFFKPFLVYSRILTNEKRSE